LGISLFVYRFKKESVQEGTAVGIFQKVWNEFDSRDIRDVVKIARLAGSSQEVPFVVRMMKKQR
jgi:hypothetical protein